MTTLGEGGDRKDIIFIDLIIALNSLQNLLPKNIDLAQIFDFSTNLIEKWGSTSLTQWSMAK